MKKRGFPAAPPFVRVRNRDQQSLQLEKSRSVVLIGVDSPMQYVKGCVPRVERLPSSDRPAQDVGRACELGWPRAEHSVGADRIDNPRT
jgi:hypothetical protein